jgi:phosphate transport system permease protein
VIGGIMLGLGRALGETMSNLRDRQRLPIGPRCSTPATRSPGAGEQFNEAADPVHRASLISLGLVLFLLTFIVLAFSRLLIAQLARGEGRST